MGREKRDLFFKICSTKLDKADRTKRRNITAIAIVVDFSIPLVVCDRSRGNILARIFWKISTT